MRVVCSNPEFHNCDGGFRWVPPMEGHSDPMRAQGALEVWQTRVREHRDFGCAGTSPFPRARGCPAPRQLPRSA